MFTLMGVAYEKPARRCSIDGLPLVDGRGLVCR
jgi:hypothetical protein